MNFRAIRFWIGGVVLAGVAGVPSSASASGFASAYFGGEHGNVVENNALSLYYNPGALAFGKGTDLFVDGELVVRHATWDHPAQAPDPNAPALPTGFDYANTGRATLLNVFGGPALAASHQFGDLALGVGLFAPFAGSESWSKNPTAADPSFPLAAAGIQRWHVIDASLAFIYATLGAAYRFGPVSIGVAGNVIFGSTSTTQAHTLTNVVDSTSEGRATLDVSGVYESFGAGAMVEALPEHLWFGLSYQAQPGVGAQTMKGTLRYDVQGTQTKYDVDVHQALPDIIRAGLRIRPTEDWELRLFGDYTRWSVLKSQCVNIHDPAANCTVYGSGADASPAPHYVLANLVRNWRDTFGLRAGASYWLTRGVELFGGAGFETGAVPDATIEPATMDGDNVRLSLGGRVRLTNAIYAAASYTQLYFFDRTVTASELYAVGGTDVRYPTQQQDGNGMYTQWIGIFDANLEAKF
jgi:long-chain fatty acid transport protein